MIFYSGFPLPVGSLSPLVPSPGRFSLSFSISLYRSLSLSLSFSWMLGGDPSRCTPSLFLSSLLSSPLLCPLLSSLLSSPLSLSLFLSPFFVLLSPLLSYSSPSSSSPLSYPILSSPLLYPLLSVQVPFDSSSHTDTNRGGFQREDNRRGDKNISHAW